MHAFVVSESVLLLPRACSGKSGQRFSTGDVFLSWLLSETGSSSNVNGLIKLQVSSSQCPS